MNGIVNSMFLKPGIYRHHKGGQYKLIGVGVQESDLSEVVIYQSLHDTPDFKKGTFWVRPLKNFSEIITVDGKATPRFTIEE